MVKLIDDAERVALRLWKGPVDRRSSPAAIRDACDMQMGGELDTTQLDIMVRMVERRLNAWASGWPWPAEHEARMRKLQRRRR